MGPAALLPPKEVPTFFVKFVTHPSLLTFLHLWSRERRECHGTKVLSEKGYKIYCARFKKEGEKKSI